ncbi:MAG: DUF554 domain-containing protein [Lachnospiraceae bacterium]|jgi:uncharacterized membrane protein YqgA involved in biofilm formation
MVGIGTIVNGAAVIAGGIIGLCCKKGMSQRFQDIIMQAAGLAVLFIGISGALEKMFAVQDGSISTHGTMMVVLSLVIGAFIGELLNIEKHIEDLGEWLKKKLKSEGDSLFMEGFLTTSLTICIGAMAVVGSLQDGLLGDPSMLFTKAILDGVIVIVFAAAFGKGAICSVVPLVLFQGSITLFAKLIEPFLTNRMIDGMSMIGSMLIFCVGLNILFPKKMKVANMLPSLVIAVIYVVLGF